jgi:hypothetical protein
MERGEFTELIGKICDYWAWKLPTDKVRYANLMESWFQVVQDIPAGYGERIFRSFTRLSTRPGNIPMVIRDIFNGLTKNPDHPADFLISMVMRHARQCELDFLAAFYDLRYAITKKQVNIGPCVRWLRSQGFVVRLEKLDEPMGIDFRALVNSLGRCPDWLERGKRTKG